MWSSVIQSTNTLQCQVYQGALMLYLQKSTKVMLQTLLMTLRHYVNDYPEKNRHTSVISYALNHIKRLYKEVLPKTLNLFTGIQNSNIYNNLSEKSNQVENHLVELTAISWLSLLAIVRTSKSWTSTVGRNLMMTWVSTACRHLEIERIHVTLKTA